MSSHLANTTVARRSGKTIYNDGTFKTPLASSAEAVFLQKYYKMNSEQANGLYGYSLYIL